MDAPGFHDNQLKEKDVALMLVQAVLSFRSGLTAFLYVIRVGRYEEKDFNAYLRLKELFGNDISKYMIVVFTGGDDLERDGETIDDVLDDAPPTLQEVLEDCGKRFVVFNNFAEDKGPQRNSLLQKVGMMMAANGNVPFSCPRYATPGMKLQEEVNRIIREADQRYLENHPFVHELKKKKREVEEKFKQRDEKYMELVRQGENEAASNAYKENEIQTQKKKLEDLEKKIKDIGLQLEREKKTLEENIVERIKRAISNEINHRDRNHHKIRDQFLQFLYSIVTSVVHDFVHQKMKEMLSNSPRNGPEFLDCVCPHQNAMLLLAKHHTHNLFPKVFDSLKLSDTPLNAIDSLPHDV